MHLRPRLVATQLLLLSCALFGVAMQPNVAPVQGQDGGDEPVKDGKWFYTRNCSGCHNDNGDGHGATIVALGLTARDFKQGGFAFGDSREAITRTINTGIPGRSPMPSFKGILKDDEIGLVVDYVRTLMPARKDEAPKNTEMIVKDRPVIARGKLPPLVEGGKDIPRGLLIGTPEGMTFEYDLEDVKLIAVRLGGFADREDWSDRGGAYLKPLGQLVWRIDPPQAATEPHALPGDDVIHVTSSAEPNVLLARPTRCELRSTHCVAGNVGLSYEVCPRQGPGVPLARIDEKVSSLLSPMGVAFRRTWQCALQKPNDGVAFRMKGPLWDFKIIGADLHARETPDGDVEVTLFTTKDHLSCGGTGMGGGDTWWQAKPHEGQAVVVTATTIRVPKLTSDVANQIRKELSK